MSYARQAVTRLTLNMRLPDAQGSFSCTLGDVNRRLEVTLIDHGEPFALPPDWTAFLAGVKPDGTRLANSCVVDRGRIIYDFSGGAEIATCPGVFAVVFEVYDELGELVATPKVWVHVADNAGARIVNSADQFSILSELIGRINGVQEDANDLKVKVEDLMDKAASAGTVTIPMSEWTDDTPTMTSVAVSGVDVGSIILMLPADEKTRLTANNAKLSAYPVAFTPVGGDSSVSIFRAEAETVPDSDMTFAYIVLKTGFSFTNPIAAIVGVDAYGEGGGGSGGGGSVDPEIVNQVLVAASNAQTSAKLAQTSAESAEAARDAAESAAKRAEDAAGSVGGSGGAGSSIVVGDVKPESPCIWFNTSGYTSDPEPEPEPVKYTVIYNLTNCESREGGENFEVDAGIAFQDTIIPLEGYVLDTVSVTMGGTALAVSDGTFYIASVTGNIIITATANPKTYSITKNLTKCSINNSANTVSHGSSYSVTITADEGHELQSVTVTMGGSAVNVTNGVISIASVTGNIVITATAKEIVMHSITYNYNHDEVYRMQTVDTVPHGGTLNVAFQANNGYVIKSVTTKMGSETVTAVDGGGTTQGNISSIVSNNGSQCGIMIMPGSFSTGVTDDVTITIVSAAE